MKKKRLLKEIRGLVGIIWELNLKNQALTRELENRADVAKLFDELEVENQMLVGDSQTDAVIIADLTKKVSALREENNALIKSNQVLLEKNMKLVGRQYIDPPKKRRWFYLWLM